MKKSNLVLHCGARKISREELDKIAAPEPTATWHPVRYGRLVLEVEKALKMQGMKIVNSAFAVTQNNERMFGLLQVEGGGGTESKEYGYVVGLRGSINKSLSEGIAVGSAVFVCDNLSFSSEIVYHRKNTKNIDEELPKVIGSAVGELKERYSDQQERFEAYKNTPLSDSQAHDLFMKVAREKVFPWARGQDVFNEFLDPRHKEFADRNVWSFFNAVTEHLKPQTENSKATALWSLPFRTGILHRMCDEVAGLELTPVFENEG